VRATGIDWVKEFLTTSDAPTTIVCDTYDPPWAALSSEDSYGGSEIEDEDLERLWFDHLMRVYADEEIADQDYYVKQIRERWPQIPPGREALVAWLAEVREDSSYPAGPLTLQEQADNLNECEDRMRTGRHWIVFAGDLVVKGGTAHQELQARERQLAQAGKATPAIVEPVVRARPRERRRSAASRSRTQASGDSDPLPPARRGAGRSDALELAASPIGEAAVSPIGDVAP
jgi:hypothetical protein